MYPSNNGCSAYTTETACLVPPAQFAGGTLCKWNSDSSSCSLNDPPSSVEFTIILAILTSTLTLPCSMLLEYLIYEVNTCRPKLETFGRKFDFLLGERIEDPELEKLEEEYMNEDRHGMVVQQIKHILTTYSIHRSRGYQNFYMDRVMRKLGLSYNHAENQLQLDAIDKFVNGGTPDSRILDAVKKSTERALIIQRTLISFGNTGEEFDRKTDTLLRFFVAEFLKGRVKEAFKDTYLALPRDVQETIEPLPWLLSWTFITLLAAFILYWILQWGTANGDTIVAAWGINYLTSFAYTVCVQECIKILVLKVLFVYVLYIISSFLVVLTVFRHCKQSRIEQIYERVKAPSSKELRNRRNLVHLLSPSIIAAGFEENRVLQTARLLRKIDDTKASNIIWLSPSNDAEVEYIRDVCEMGAAGPKSHDPPESLDVEIMEEDEILPHPMAWQGSWLASADDSQGLDV